MRFIISLAIVVIVLTYLVIPFYQSISGWLKKEFKRIERNLNEDNKNKKDGWK